MIKLFPNLSHIWIAFNLILLLFSCTQEEVQEKIFIDERIPDEIADSVFITSIDKNELEYELYAIQIEKFYNTGETFADTVFVKTYDESGNIKSTLYCDRAKLDETVNKLEGTGNVVVESENGILKTNYIIWDRNSNKIFAKKGVTLLRGDNILYGQEMETDIYLNRIEIIKVSAEGKVDEQEINW